MNVLKSKWGTVIAAVLVIWIGFGITRIHQSRTDLGKNTEELNARLNQVEKENTQLEQDLNNLDNPEYLKAQAKIQLNYKESEEELVYIYRDKEDSQNQQATIENREDMPRYKKWWHWLLYTE